MPLRLYSHAADHYGRVQDARATLDHSICWVSLNVVLLPGGELTLYLDSAAFYILADDIGADNFWKMDGFYQRAYCEINLKSLLGRISPQWHSEIRVERVCQLNTADVVPDSNMLALGLSAEEGFGCGSILLNTAELDIGNVAASLIANSRPHCLNVRETVPLHLLLCCGRTILRASQLKKLEINDVIVLAADEFYQKIQVCLQGKTLFLANYQGSQLTIETLLRSEVMSQTTPSTNLDGIDPQDQFQYEDAPAEEALMAAQQAADADEFSTSPDIHQDAASELPADRQVQGTPGLSEVITRHDGGGLIDSNEIQVTVEFSLGTIVKTLAQLEQLAEGHLIELPKDLAQCVDVCVNGKQLATGEPVNINGNMGIRILSINATDVR